MFFSRPPDFTGYQPTFNRLLQPVDLSKAS